MKVNDFLRLIAPLENVRRDPHRSRAFRDVSSRNFIPWFLSLFPVLVSFMGNDDTKKSLSIFFHGVGTRAEKRLRRPRRRIASRGRDGCARLS